MASYNKYSIILPLRNGGDYLKHCVNSILSQTYRGFTLHVLENCSTDGSLQWLEQIKDSRLVLIPSSRPLTIEENWKRILQINKNEFITLVGHDDVLHPEYLETIDDLVRNFPNASLYQTHFNLINSQGKEIRKCKPMALTQTAPEFLSEVLNNRFDLFGTGYMMRAADYEELGGIPDYPNLLFADFELWMNITRKSFLATSAKECFSYRVHESTTKKSPDNKMHEAFGRFVRYLKFLSEQDPVLAKLVAENFPGFLDRYCASLAHRLLRTPLSKRGITVKQFINYCQGYNDALLSQREFDLSGKTSVRLAALIDSNPLTRQLFLWWKAIFPQPVRR